MIGSLNRTVIQKLKANGFTGRYPHYRKDCGDHIKLVSFQTNKYGGSFTVEISAAFPDGKDKNFSLYGNMTKETLNVTATDERYRLPGMFDGWFYYSDVYRKNVPFFGRVYRSGKNAVKEKGWRLVQAFDEKQAAYICEEVDRQLQKGFERLERFIAKCLYKR